VWLIIIYGVVSLTALNFPPFIFKGYSLNSLEEMTNDLEDSSAPVPGARKNRGQHIGRRGCLSPLVLRASRAALDLGPAALPSLVWGGPEVYRPTSFVV
jgi:hypothetical protein